MSGRRALVTGAARGIGRAVAERLRKEGAEVILADREVGSNAGAGRAAALDVLPCDCADEADVDRLFERAGLAAGLDILVNNAGSQPGPAALHRTVPTDWDATIRNNLRSVYVVSRRAIPVMRDGGAILNIGSLLALRGVPDCAAYSASKAAIAGLTRSMARDLAPRIRVNCLHPGAIDTRMFDTYVRRTRSPAAERERIRATIPLGRLGAPEDIAAAAAFLVGPEAAWITGIEIPVDGGDSL
ncbi:MAG: glucose 1-dehydrogenase [Gemmatimonadota bacterium]|nr:glucose 1-dehydrogenase [Gemmatimonadota bacterium]